VFEGVMAFVVIVVVEIVEVVAVFMEEVMVFLVVVVVEIFEVDVHATNIDPEEPINMLSFFAFEFTQETPQSI
jgi:hypothetical protein